MLPLGDAVIRDKDKQRVIEEPQLFHLVEEVPKPAVSHGELP
jgi:hypothetical protein